MNGLTKEDVELFNKIKMGLRLATERFYEQRAANNETVVISVNGEVKHVLAREILNRRKQI